VIRQIEKVLEYEIKHKEDRFEALADQALEMEEFSEEEEVSLSEFEEAGLQTWPSFIVRI